MKRKRSKGCNKQDRLSEVREIELLNLWIQSQKPDCGSNPMSLPSLPLNAPIGDLGGGLYSRYAGATRFDQLPISKKLKDGLRKANYFEMTDIQRASLPHALCGRDILGAAKTGSGKTLAFVIPVLEKLYKERWGPEDGVGSIIISPTRELAVQLFEVLKTIGKHHNFSAGLLIGGRKDVDTEKERVNDLNILVCTPGRLLQHMDETPNFDCSQLQVLVLDEADRILDVGFKKALNAIISQLPKYRQTMLFSATQTKSVQDLARLSLKDPEYLSVHKDALTATPNLLQQTAMIVPLEQKLDMLWSFIKSHLNSKILVFLSSCKQVKFVFEAFKKLRPGIPLKCLHGKMRQERRIGIYSEFCEQRAVLFSTDVVSRGLDFDKAVDWVVQVDCPDNVDSYIHRVGRTARYQSKGRSVLFLIPSEMKMLEKLQEDKVPVNFVKANLKRLQPVSGLLSALLVKYPEMQQLAQRAFITYLRSINMQSDKEIFDITKMPIDEFSASLGLPMTPKVRFLKQKIKRMEVSGKTNAENSEKDIDTNIPREKLDISDLDEDIVKKAPLSTANTPKDMVDKAGQIEDVIPATRVSKKKKLRINIHRPVGSRVVFDDDGNTLPPLARIADIESGGDAFSLDKDKKNEHYKKMRAEMKQADNEDKLLHRERLREKRIKMKMKMKMEKKEDSDSGSEDKESTRGDRSHKRQKKYFDSESDVDEKEEEKKNSPDFAGDAISLAAQEELALKLLSSMHK